MTAESPEPAPKAARQLATVVKVEGILSRVALADGTTYRAACRARIFRHEEARLAVGDHVEVVGGEEEGGEAIIEAISDRRNLLSRVKSGGRVQVICANIDQVVVVVAAAAPTCRQGFVDRVLVSIEHEGLQPLVCVNKLDLSDRARVEEEFGAFGRAGYQVIATSAATGEGLDHLRAALAHKTSVFTGPSGVGKSTLLNSLLPGADLATEEVSEKTGKGRHKTRAAELFVLPGGGCVGDTPGVRTFGLQGVTAEDLPRLFPEFTGRACHYYNCTHRDEPGCAVREAVTAGAVDERRYDSYLRIREEL